MMANLQAGEHDPVRLVGRRGAGPGRLDGLRRGALAGRARPHRAVHELRHGRLAELHLHGVRRRRVDVPGAGGRADPGSVRRSRTSTSPTTRGSASPTTTPSSPAAATIRRSSRTASPPGGLFTGAEVLKTAEQQAIWGGVAGEQFDPCYHEACDDIDNVDLHALEVNSDLIAFAQLTFAYSTESVNGVRGKRVPGPALHAAGPGRPGGHVRRGGRRPRAAPARQLTYGVGAGPRARPTAASKGSACAGVLLVGRARTRPGEGAAATGSR